MTRYHTKGDKMIGALYFLLGAFLVAATAANIATVIRMLELW